MSERIQQKRSLLSNSRTAATVYTIPVVVHIIHNGEVLGSGANIPEEQIYSQIETLNEDYRRLNADASNTPSEFLPVAADIEIEFVLAKTDPQGLPTTGITRTTGNRSSYSLSQLDELPELSYWDSYEYFNMWVTGLSDEYIGYATFPLSNLDGMDIERNTDPTMDGIFIDYRYFGTGYNTDDFSRGRTVTHEVGHWLGLRHIWGDSNVCSQDDYCEDTPLQNESTSPFLSCEEASSSATCGSTDMIQNYMDYTADECMNIFTEDQKDRMRTVLENSPRRKELLTSPGLNEAVQVANDLGIYEILSPGSGQCDNEVQPSIMVRNYGTNTISSFEIVLLLNDSEIQRRDITSTLDPLDVLQVDFSSIFTSSTLATFSFEIISTNDMVDGNSENNELSITTYLPELQDIPLYESFDGDDLDELSFYIPENSSWIYSTAANENSDNTAVMLPYGSGPSTNYGSIDWLITPTIDIIGLATLDMSFRYAYTERTTATTDALQIIVSTDCGATFPEENTVFMEWAEDLGTTSATDEVFFPSGAGDWKEVEINLSEFADEDQITLAFVGYNGTGNNLFLDELLLTTSSITNYDVMISDIHYLPVVSCQEEFTAEVMVRNNGFLNLTSFNISTILGEETQEETITRINLAPGEEVGVEVYFSDLEEGEHILEVAVSSPNGATDEVTSNNQMSSYFAIDRQSEGIPIKIDFLSQIPYEAWTFYSPTGEQNWDIYVAPRQSYTRSLYFDAYNIETTDEESFFVSPILDLSGEDEASLEFDYSYAYLQGKNDRLQVLVSTDCGQSFDEILFDKNGASLAIIESQEEWFPSEDEDWIREHIDLSDYAGSSTVRVAFVFTNQNGNNLFIDNVEFFDVAEPKVFTDLEDKIRVYPNPAADHLFVKLNLLAKQKGTLRLINMNGEVMMEETLENNINQIYEINNLAIPAGVYILQFLGDLDQLSQRVLIGGAN